MINIKLFFFPVSKKKRYDKSIIQYELGRPFLSGSKIILAEFNTWSETYTCDAVRGINIMEPRTASVSKIKILNAVIKLSPNDIKILMCEPHLAEQKLWSGGTYCIYKMLNSSMQRHTLIITVLPVPCSPISKTALPCFMIVCKRKTVRVLSTFGTNIEA